MGKAFTYFAKWLLYSHLYIGLCAAALTGLTFHLLRIPLTLGAPEIILAGAGATLVYILHRQIGMMRVVDMKLPERYKRILPLNQTTLVFSFLCLGGIVFAFYALPPKEWHTMILPFFLTLGYLLPVFGGRRGRDLPYIKILLVATVWAWVTVVLPALRQYRGNFPPPLYLMTIERALFIFAITLPFDIRDMEEDRQSGTKTIPNVIQLSSSKWIASLSLLAALLIDVLLTRYYHLIDLPVFAGFVLTYVLSLGLVRYSRPGLPDWYYTGLIDGLMLVLPASIALMEWILH